MGNKNVNNNSSNNNDNGQKSVASLLSQFSSKNSGVAAGSMGTVGNCCGCQHSCGVGKEGNIGNVLTNQSLNYGGNNNLCMPRTQSKKNIPNNYQKKLIK